MQSPNPHQSDSFDAVMSEGKEFVRMEDLANARRCFVKAHELGHENVDEHIRCHLSLLTVAWRERKILESVSHLCSVFSLQLVGRFF